MHPGDDGSCKRFTMIFLVLVGAAVATLGPLVGIFVMDPLVYLELLQFQVSSTGGMARGSPSGTCVGAASVARWHELACAGTAPHPPTSLGAIAPPAPLLAPLPACPLPQVVNPKTGCYDSTKTYQVCDTTGIYTDYYFYNITNADQARGGSGSGGPWFLWHSTTSDRLSPPSWLHWPSPPPCCSGLLGWSLPATRRSAPTSSPPMRPTTSWSGPSTGRRWPGPTTSGRRLSPISAAPTAPCRTTSSASTGGVGLLRRGRAW